MILSFFASNTFHKGLIFLQYNYVIQHKYTKNYYLPTIFIACTLYMHDARAQECTRRRIAHTHIYINIFITHSSPLIIHKKLENDRGFGNEVVMMPTRNLPHPHNSKQL